MNTCCLYVRVSSEGQSLENQVPDLMKIAQVRGLEIVEVYSEKISAAKERPAFDKMMLDAHRGRFKHAVLWSLDRLGRSMTGNLSTVLELDRIGVTVVSVKEAWLDTAGPVRSLLIAIFSWVAEQERRRVGERTRIGQDRARRAGKVIGRPRVLVNLPIALQLRAAGVSIRASAAKMKVGAGTLHRALQAHDALRAATATNVPEVALDPVLANLCNHTTAIAA